MTTKELKDRVSVSLTTMYGHYKVRIKYRGKEYSCITTDSLSYDAIKWHDEDEKTERQALLSLYNECKRKNDLR